MKNDELFYVGQKAVIHKNGLVLILHDPIPKPGHIDLPGGKIQEGERDFIKALQREVFEETNLRIKVNRPFYTNFWEFPKDSPHRNKGKKIYLVYYDCEYVSGKVKISTEHDWYKWVNKDGYVHLAIGKSGSKDALDCYFKDVFK